MPERRLKGMATLAGGSYRIGDLEVPRIGYGAMRLSGPHIFGPPKDRDEAVAVLRTAVELGVRHIDTSDFYGPHVTNEIIREALHPYPDDLVLVTKVGARRDAKGNWPTALAPDELRQAVQDNLRNLGVDVLDVVNLRVESGKDGMTPLGKPLGEQFEVLADLQEQGLIKHLGVSTVTAQQVAEARTIAPVVEVQNMYNLAQRGDDDLIVELEHEEIAYVPYFPLGGFTPLQSGELDAVASELGASAMGVALAWLLQRSPNVLLIPGTSSVAHLRENIEGASLTLPPEAVARLDAIAA